MESTNNISFVPLQTGRAFIGTYDTITQYASAVISLFSDTACEIYMYQSQNKTGTYVSTYNSVAGTQFVQEVQLTAPYVYFVVRNDSIANQTKLSFTVIYKTAYAGANFVTSNVNLNQVGGSDISLGQKYKTQSLPVVIASDDVVNIGGTVSLASGTSVGIIGNVVCDIASGSTVNIEGGNSTAVSVDGDVGISAILLGTKTALSASSLVGGDVALQVYQSGWGRNSDRWYNGTFVASSGGGLGKQYILSQIQVGNLGHKQISIYGTVSALEGGTTPLNLTIVYSENNTDWYDASLGVINFTTIGDFSRDWTTSANFVSIYADTPATVKIFYSTSM